MYSLDGVPLANPALGWRFKRDSEPRVSRGLDRPDFNASNRDGTIIVRGHVTTPTITLAVDAPGTSIETLQRLMRLGRTLTRTADPSIALDVQAVTITPGTITPAGPGLYRLTVVYRIPAVWWRDVATTDWSSNLPVSTGAGAANMAVLTATTAHVHDSVILIEGGAADTLRFTGVNGTWVQVTGLQSGWTRIDCARGRVFGGSLTDGKDRWTDTSFEETSYLNSGAYPYFLELAASSTGAPGCTLAVSWNSVQQSPKVTLRAKNSYDR